MDMEKFIETKLRELEYVLNGDRWGADNCRIRALLEHLEQVA